MSRLVAENRLCALVFLRGTKMVVISPNEGVVGVACLSNARWEKSLEMLARTIQRRRVVGPPVTSDDNDKMEKFAALC
jgi:uncharacterized protein (DUF2384 family)